MQSGEQSRAVSGSWINDGTAVPKVIGFGVAKALHFRSTEKLIIHSAPPGGIRSRSRTRPPLGQHQQEVGDAHEAVAVEVHERISLAPDRQHHEEIVA